MKSRRLRRAPNGARAAAAAGWLEKALDPGHHFNRSFLIDHGWLVVPVESGQHFDGRDAKCLARAATTFGVTKLRAVPIENLEYARDHWEVDVSEEGLLRFGRECAHFNFVLIPDTHAFAVVCTTDDYFLVGGPKPFVERAVGKAIVEARADFEEFASSETWSATDRTRLLFVSRRYKGVADGECGPTPTS